MNLRVVVLCLLVLAARWGASETRPHRRDPGGKTNTSSPSKPRETSTPVQPVSPTPSAPAADSENATPAERFVIAVNALGREDYETAEAILLEIAALWPTSPDVQPFSGVAR